MEPIHVGINEQMKFEPHNSKGQIFRVFWTCLFCPGCCPHRTPERGHGRHSVHRCWCLWYYSNTVRKKNPKSYLRQGSWTAWLQASVRSTATHSARDRWIPLGLGDQVAQQGVGAKESQADVGSLGEVLQHRRVGEPLSARPAVDKRHHNLEKHAFISQQKGLWSCYTQVEDLVTPLRSPTERCANILWYRAGHRHVIYAHWAASQTVQCTHALNLGEERQNSDMWRSH